MVVVDGQGLPLGNYLDLAFLAEVTLIEPMLDRVGVLDPVGVSCEKILSVSSAIKPPIRIRCGLGWPGGALS